jgi:hypothetical protein
MRSLRFTKQQVVIVVISFFSIVGQRVPLASGGQTNGPKLIHTEAVGQITITSLLFGGSTTCDSATGAGGCEFYNLAGESSGWNSALGPFTATLNATVLIGADSPNGAHDSDGTPTEFCFPELGTETDTFKDGSTLTSNFQGLSCCAATVCTAGLPSVNHDSSVITGATGHLSGAAGGFSWSDNFATPSGPLLLHAEGVLELPSNPY